MKNWFRVCASVASAVVVSAGIGCHCMDGCSECESTSGYNRPEIPAPPADEMPAAFPTGTPVGVSARP